MRRTSSLILLGLAVFCVALAPLLREFVFPRLVADGLRSDKAYQVIVSEAENATLLGAPEPAGGARVTIVHTVRPDPGAGDGDTVVWDLNLVMLDSTGRVITSIPERYAFDAVNQVPRNCCGESIDGKDAAHTGLQYKFPFFTEKRDYNYYDAQSRTASPIHYKGTERRGGLETYVFEQEVPWVKVPLPSVLPFGLDPRKVEQSGQERWYTTVRRMWVEPVTGTLVYVEERRQEEMRTPPPPETPDAPATRVTWFDGRITTKAEWSQHLIDIAGRERGRLLLVHDRLPLGLLIAGGCLFLGALLCERLAGRRVAAASGTPGTSGTSATSGGGRGPAGAPAATDAGKAAGAPAGGGDGDGSVKSAKGAKGARNGGSAKGAKSAKDPQSTRAAEASADTEGAKGAEDTKAPRRTGKKPDPAAADGPASAPATRSGADAPAAAPPARAADPVTAVLPAAAGEVSGTVHGTNGSSAATAYAEGSGPADPPGA